MKQKTSSAGNASGRISRKTKTADTLTAKKNRQSGQTKMVVQVSWEVCNKVGGIYTVLSTQARALTQVFHDNLIYIGPLFGDGASATAFEQDNTLFPELKDKAVQAGIPLKIGRWQVPGQPIVVLVDWRPLFANKNDIYTELWNRYGVDSLHSYDDYDDATLFGWQAGRVAKLIIDIYGKNDVAGYKDSKATLFQNAEIQEMAGKDCIVQAHEWMSGAALLYAKAYIEGVATVFTTHATTVGRSITTNNKLLYAYFDGYHGDQMAEELNVQSKHSMEKAAAQQCDCMTTVSELTDRECGQFLERKSDVLLPNGFDPSFVRRGSTGAAIRKKARKSLLSIYNALNGTNLGNDTLIVSTSGRNDFRCKGFDVFLSTVRKLQLSHVLEKDVLMIIAVPCWKKEPRADLLQRLENRPPIKIFDASEYPALPQPFITHTLYNPDDDRIMQCIRANGISFGKEERVHLLFIPSYLDGEDGILNLCYYDFLTASDYCVYPSYYEPWGYTPLESAAFGIPCLTTTLSGFGQWVNKEVGHQTILSDGVAVIPRSDWNYDECVEATATSIEGISLLNTDEYQRIQEAARQLAAKAQWKDFILNYLNAYTLAIKKSEK